MRKPVIPMSKPVIIDYPVERTLLKQEFGKIAAMPGFLESVEMGEGSPSGNLWQTSQWGHCNACKKEAK